MKEKKIVCVLSPNVLTSFAPSRRLRLSQCVYVHTTHYTLHSEEVVSGNLGLSDCSLWLLTNRC